MGEEEAEGGLTCCVANPQATAAAGSWKAMRKASPSAAYMSHVLGPSELSDLGTRAYGGKQHA